MIKNYSVLFVALAFFSAAPKIDAGDGLFGDRVQLRGNLDRSRAQFQQRKQGRIAFLGGSITEMDGYRPMVCDLLKKRFPETEFKFVNAGISSTSSTTGAFRLASDVFADGPVDLLFVEFAVNDDQDGFHSRAECIRGMEGIIRHARALNPKVDIVVTFFINEGMLKKLRDGQTPLTIEAHEAVAAHYAISTINLAKEVAGQISAQKLTWKQYGGVHPAKFGNAIGASMIDELFNQAWALPQKDETPGAHAMPEPLDPLNYSAGRFIDLGKAQLKSGWVLGVPEWKTLKGSTRSRFTSIPILSAVEPGAELSLEFEGTAVGAFILAGPDAGVAEASIDGGAFIPVNLFHQYSSGLHYPCTVLLGTDLQPGKHMLSLRVSNETHSAGHAMRIMQFTAN